jgi:uncharacterized protein YqgV (UPF0045/DUF77 family)
MNSVIKSYSIPHEIKIAKARHLNEILSDIGEIMRAISQNNMKRVATNVKTAAFNCGERIVSV